MSNRDVPPTQLYPVDALAAIGQQIADYAERHPFILQTRFVVDQWVPFAAHHPSSGTHVTKGQLRLRPSGKVEVAVHHVDPPASVNGLVIGPNDSAWPFDDALEKDAAAQVKAQEAAAAKLQANTDKAATAYAKRYPKCPTCEGVLNHQLFTKQVAQCTTKTCMQVFTHEELEA